MYLYFFILIGIMFPNNCRIFIFPRWLPYPHITSYYISAPLNLSSALLLVSELRNFFFYPNDITFSRWYLLYSSPTNKTHGLSLTAEKLNGGGNKSMNSSVNIHIRRYFKNIPYTIKPTLWPNYLPNNLIPWKGMSL